MTAIVKMILSKSSPGYTDGAKNGVTIAAAPETKKHVKRTFLLPTVSNKNPMRIMIIMENGIG